MIEFCIIKLIEWYWVEVKLNLCGWIYVVVDRLLFFDVIFDLVFCLYGNICFINSGIFKFKYIVIIIMMMEIKILVEIFVRNIIVL